MGGLPSSPFAAAGGGGLGGGGFVRVGRRRPRAEVALAARCRRPCRGAARAAFSATPRSPRPARAARPRRRGPAPLVVGSRRVELVGPLIASSASVRSPLPAGVASWASSSRSASLTALDLGPSSPPARGARLGAGGRSVSSSLLLGALSARGPASGRLLAGGPPRWPAAAVPPPLRRRERRGARRGGGGGWVVGLVLGPHGPPPSLGREPRRHRDDSRAPR